MLAIIHQLNCTSVLNVDLFALAGRCWSCSLCIHVSGSAHW